MTLLKSNIVITEKNDALPLIKFFEELGKKILSSKIWKDCALCRFLLIDATSFESAKKFFAGENASAPKSRGALLTQICNKVEIAQKRIAEPEKTLKFVSKFLKDLDVAYNEFLTANVPNILKDEIATDHSEEVKEREREEKKMMEQLQKLNEATQTVEKTGDAMRVFRSASVVAGSEKTPDFMGKFMEESDKLIVEGGKEFFNPVKSVTDLSEFRKAFDQIIFDTESSDA